MGVGEADGVLHRDCAQVVVLDAEAHSRVVRVKPSGAINSPTASEEPQIGDFFVVRAQCLEVHWRHIHTHAGATRVAHATTLVAAGLHLHTGCGHVVHVEVAVAKFARDLRIEDLAPLVRTHEGAIDGALILAMRSRATEVAPAQKRNSGLS